MRADFSKVTGGFGGSTATVVDPYLYSNNIPFVLQMKKDLERHEGYRYYAYPDPLSALYKKYPGLDWGYKPARELLALVKDMDEDDGRPWTVGFGDTHGVSPDSVAPRQQAERRLEQHIMSKDAQIASVLPWYKDASFVTRTVLLNMAFNMGVQGLLGFTNTLRFVKNKDYERAAHNMTLSLWYRQVGNRAKELVERMRTQEIKSEHRANTRL